MCSTSTATAQTTPTNLHLTWESEREHEWKKPRPWQEETKAETQPRVSQQLWWSETFRAVGSKNFIRLWKTEMNDGQRVINLNDYISKIWCGWRPNVSDLIWLPLFTFVLSATSSAVTYRHIGSVFRMNSVFEEGAAHTRSRQILRRWKKKSGWSKKKTGKRWMIWERAVGKPRKEKLLVQERSKGSNNPSNQTLELTFVTVCCCCYRHY